MKCENRLLAAASHEIDLAPVFRHALAHQLRELGGRVTGNNLKPGCPGLPRSFMAVALRAGDFAMYLPSAAGSGPFGARGASWRCSSAPAYTDRSPGRREREAGVQFEGSVSPSHRDVHVRDQCAEVWSSRLVEHRRRHHDDSVAVRSDAVAKDAHEVLLGVALG